MLKHFRYKSNNLTTYLLTGCGVNISFFRSLDLSFGVIVEDFLILFLGVVIRGDEKLDAEIMSILVADVLDTKSLSILLLVELEDDFLLFVLGFADSLFLSVIVKYLQKYIFKLLKSR